MLTIFLSRKEEQPTHTAGRDTLVFAIKAVATCFKAGRNAAGFEHHSLQMSRHLGTWASKQVNSYTRLNKRQRKPLFLGRTAFFLMLAAWTIVYHLG